ncbi:MAG TPA: PilC/PilY family type IV pilus protein [Methylococcaceae bacterium]|nr:PilC/PilY family type IV pilus protein [Methylococcaceae bacterium]
MTRKTIHLAALLVGMTMASGLYADDTDIYFNNPNNAPGAPLVMLSLDYRSNLGATVCTGGTLAGCQKLFEQGYLAKDPSTQTIVFNELLRAVLKKVIDPIEGLKIGFMMNHNNENNCAGPRPDNPNNNQKCSNGGYMLQGFRLFENNADGTPNQAKIDFYNKLAAIPIPQGNLAHSYQGKELYFEFFRYLTGQDIYNGHNGYTDFGTNNTHNIDSASDSYTGAPAMRWDTSIEVGDEYISPLLEDCVKIYVINFMFAVSNQEDDSDAAIKAAKADQGMGGIVLTGNKNTFSTVIEYLYDADLGDGTFGDVPDLEETQNVTSYFFVDSSQLTQANQKGYALAGGTGSAFALSDDPDQLAEDLQNVFRQILSVSATFVSASVPVNITNRTQSLNNVFFALFQPMSIPQWPGNAKRLRLGQNSDLSLKVTDATCAIADTDASGNFNLIDSCPEVISATDGRIIDNALTFWTTATGWDVVAATDPEVSGRDGKSVDRGGAGQKIPGFLNATPGDVAGGDPGTSNGVGTRQLFTEPDTFTNGTPTTLLNFNADATTAEKLWPYLRMRGTGKVYGVPASCSLASTDTATCAWSDQTAWASATTDTDGDGISDQTEAVDLLKFARGIDVNDQDGDGSQTDVRPWIMADPLHSKPLPINYGARTGYSTTLPDIRLLVGGNDGFLHMVRNTLSGSPEGKEVWAFMPRLLAANLRPLSDNAAATKHPIGFDGAPAAFVKDGDSPEDPIITPSVNDKVWAFTGLRRGGKAIYALDISNPDIPKMLWKIEKTTAGGNFDALGWTFSDPRIANLDWGEGKKPAVFFAGGYDLDKDDTGTGTNDNEGNAIYIVNAETGALVWRAIQTGTNSSNTFVHNDLNDSIPASLTVKDTDGDGLADRIYVGDTGGVIWRADLGGFKDVDGNAATPDVLVKNDPSLWTLTKFANLGRHATGQPDRRFFHSPDVVLTRDSTGDFDAVLIGSGDREHPLSTNVDFDQFYMIRDRNHLVGIPPTSAVTVGDLGDVTNCVQAVCVGTDISNGWRFDLADGEKVLATPLTFLGDVFFTTYKPESGGGNSCGPDDGDSFFYIVKLANGTASRDLDISSEGNERSTHSGTGIPGEPVFISYQGENYVVPPNLSPEVGRPPLGSTPVFGTYWHEGYVQ